MEGQGDSLAQALFNEFDEEKVEELFQDDGTDDSLEGLLESKQKTEVIATEDLAWADSCFVADSELPMGSWDSLKEALLDSIISFSSYEENKVSGIDEADSGNDKHMELDENQEFYKDQGDTSLVLTRENATEVVHDSDDEEEAKILGTKKGLESRDNIFKLWDLREENDNDELIPELKRSIADFRLVEEEWFIAELKRVVAENIIRDEQRLPLVEATISEDGEFDELISSMGDLSLEPLS